MEKIAFLSDIHGNAVALHAVLEDVRAQGCQRIFVLGDIINGMDPSRCLTILREIKNVKCIKGNAEQYLLTPDLDAFPHKGETLYRNLLHALKWWSQRLSQTDLAFLRAFPESLHLDGLYMVHDSPLDRDAVLQVDLKGIDEKYREILFHGVGIPENLPANELHQIFKFMEQKRVSTLFVGHTHEPYIKHINGKVICNLGSVGLPLDGDPRPSWVLFEQDETGHNFAVRRVAYNIERAINRLKEVGIWEMDEQQMLDATIKMLQTGIHWRFHIK